MSGSCISLLMAPVCDSIFQVPWRCCWGFFILFFCSYFSDRPDLILISRIERKSQSVYKDKKSLNRTGLVARRSSAGRQRNLAFNSLPLVSLQYGLSVTRVASANQTSLNNFTHCNHLFLVVCLFRFLVCYCYCFYVLFMC